MNIAALYFQRITKSVFFFAFLQALRYEAENSIMCSMVKKLVLLVASAFLLSGCTVPFINTPQSGLQISVGGGEKANIFVDGINVGQSPFSSESIKPGQHAVKLMPESAERASYETTASFTPGNVTVITWSFGKSLEESGGEVFELSKATNRNKSEISIVTNPDNIVVKVDGQTKGFSPMILSDLSEGTHSLTVSAPGFVERTSSPKLVKGYRLTVTSKLSREIAGQDMVAVSPQPSPTPSPLPSPTPRPTPKPTPTPLGVLPTPTTSTSSALSSPSPSPSAGILNPTTTVKPYVEISETGTGWLRVRAEASGSSAELVKIAVGSKAPYLNETVSGWHKIEYATGKQGWVSGQYATVVK